MSGEPCNFADCIDLVAKRDSFTLTPGKWALIIGAIMTIVFFVIASLAIYPKYTDDDDENNSKTSKFAFWLETIGVYFGLVGNMTLIAYALLVYFFAKHDYHLLHPQDTFMSPILFGIIFLVNGCLLIGFLLFAQHERGSVMASGYIIGSFVGLIVLSFLIYVLAYAMIGWRATASPKQREAIAQAERELMAAQAAALQNSLQRKQEAEAAKTKAEQTIQEETVAQKKLNEVGTKLPDIAKEFSRSRKAPAGGDQLFSKTIEKSRPSQQRPAAAQPGDDDVLAALLREMRAVRGAQ